MTVKVLFAVCAMAAATVASAQVRSTTLNAPGASDLRPGELVEAPSGPMANTRRETVSLSWVTTLSADPLVASPYQAISRSSLQRVSATALNRGVTIVTDAPGAVLRVSASAGGLDPERVVLSAGGREQSLRDVSDQLVNADNLRAAGMDSKALVFGARLSGVNGAMQLRYDGALDDTATYLVSVLDKNSATAAAVQSESDQFQVASNAAVNAAWQGADGDIRWSGHAFAPDGRTYELSFDSNGRGTLVGATATSTRPGLWEWRVRGVDSRGLVRDATTAFAMTPAVARLAERVIVARGLASTDMTFDVEVRSAGRYEVRGVLTDERGAQAVVAARAQWLKPGVTAVTISFDAADIKAARLVGPLRLRDLTLTDQSRMSVQERRADALTL